MNSDDKTLQDRTKNKNNELSSKETIDTHFLNVNNYNDFKELTDTYITWKDDNLLNENICSFQELVDNFKMIEDTYDLPYLDRLLWSEEFFEALIENNKLNTDDLKYLLNTIDDKKYELRDLCRNTPLIKNILNEFVLDKETVDKFNRIIENSSWCKDHNVHTLFDRIEYEFKDRSGNNEELLKLNKLNRKVCLLNSFELTEDERFELIDVLRDNEQAQSLLKQLVDNNLQDQYDFESLKNLLTKNTEKKKIKLNL